MECEHWSNEAAIAEVQALGYDHLDVELDVLGYLEQYRPTWQQSPEPPAALPAKARPHSRKRPTTRGEKDVPGGESRRQAEHPFPPP